MLSLHSSTPHSPFAAAARMYHASRFLNDYPWKTGCEFHVVLTHNPTDWISDKEHHYIAFACKDKDNPIWVLAIGTDPDAKLTELTINFYDPEKNREAFRDYLLNYCHVDTTKIKVDSPFLKIEDTKTIVKILKLFKKHHKIPDDMLTRVLDILQKNL